VLLANVEVLPAEAVFEAAIALAAQRAMVLCFAHLLNVRKETAIEK
jgi:hypothetical protein